MAPEFVTPPPAEQARIDRERLLLDRILSAISPRHLWNDGFGRPVDGEVISVFGVRSVFNNEARAPHRGIDFRGTTGTPVRAPARGVVVLAEALYFSGSTVILDHGLGVFSMLAHLSRIDVKPGTLALRGDVIGAIGATGRVTGPPPALDAADRAGGGGPAVCARHRRRRSRGAESPRVPSFPGGRAVRPGVRPETDGRQNPASPAPVVRHG